MFVATAKFTEVPAEQEAELQEWFAWSNEQLREVDGLLGRRLLRAADGTYTALVEHQSAETFAAMHLTEVTALVRARLRQLIHGEPVVTNYQVVADLAKSASCCGGGGHGDHGEHNRALAGGRVELQVAGGSCQGA